MKKTCLYELAGRWATLRNRLEAGRPKARNAVVLFDPALESDNLGDAIILHYCLRELEALFPEGNFAHIGTHTLPSREDAARARRAKYRIVCGTNLLTSRVEHHWRWVLPPGFRGKRDCGNAILLGCGWDAYQEDCSDYTRLIYRRMLNPRALHAVRDRYTLEKLQKAGFRNVLFTGCPTTWGLTEEFCRRIPVQKAKNVVTTVTCYRPDPERDSEMLAILSRNYENISLWLQGPGDEEYVKSLVLPRNLDILPPKLEAYERILKQGNVDYVGTRLHGGIHAMNHGVRSVILSVDNRAAEMGRDLGLPVLDRNNVGSTLEPMIRREFATRVTLPLENIRRFRAQFKERNR